MDTGKKDEEKRFRILSIDGGGIRGIIPAMILDEIERQANQPISELFDLIAGTSTGGILALGLTKPGGKGTPQYTARELVDLYDTQGSQIFSCSPWHRLQELGNFLGEKYSSGPLEQVLEHYFGKVKLSQALTNVLVTSYEIEQRRPFFFKSHNARKNPQDDFLMREAARATSAAPTYFEPQVIKTDETVDYLALVDGGVFANNPAMCALVEAICKFKSDPDHIFMVSLGTGELTRPLKYRDVKDWGLLRWAQPVLDVVFDGVSDTVDYQANLILNRSGPKHYYRFQVTLNEDNEDMDNTSPDNIRALKLLAEGLIQKCQGEIGTIARILKSQAALSRQRTQRRNSAKTGKIL